MARVAPDAFGSGPNVLCNLSPESAKGHKASALEKKAILARRKSDAHIQEELVGLIDETTEWPMFIVGPSHPLRMVWDGVVALALFYIFIFTPLEVTYGEPSEPGWVTLGKAIDVLFWLDILVCFRTAYANKHGILVAKPKAIAIYYIKDFFFVDLFCCLPGYPISTIVEGLLNTPSQGFGSEAAAVKLGKAPRVLRVVRSVKMVKVLRIIKVGQIIEDLRDSFPASIVLFKMLKLLVATSFFLHINACAFSLISQQSTRGDGNSWADQLVLEDGWRSEYINALYWSTTTSTTVGFGDITPVSDTEKIFAIVSMAVGVGLYGYIIGSMTEVVTSQSYVNHMLNQRMDQVFEFIRRHEFPQGTRKAILHFCRHHFKQKKYVDERFIMELLPPLLMEQVRIKMLSNGLQQIRLFRFLDLKYFALAFHMLEPREQVPGNELVNTDLGPSPEFFIMTDGDVNIHHPTYESSFAPGATTHSARLEKVNEFISELFDKYDDSKDGNLDTTELKPLLEDLTGGAIKKEAVDDVVMALDTDGSGTIGITEFVKWFMRTRVEVPKNMKKGRILARADKLRPYGVFNAFNLSPGKPSPYRFFPVQHVSYWVVNAENIIAEFEDTISVLEIIEATIVAPARKHGPALDLKSRAELEAIVQNSVVDLEKGDRTSKKRIALRRRATVLAMAVAQSRRTVENVIPRLRDQAAIVARVQGEKWITEQKESKTPGPLSKLLLQSPSPKQALKKVPKEAEASLQMAVAAISSQLIEFQRSNELQITELREAANRNHKIFQEIQKMCEKNASSMHALLAAQKRPGL